MFSPKAFLALTQAPTANRFEITVLHWSTSYGLDIAEISPWDHRHFAFVGDVRAGNFIKTLEFPADAFALTLPGVVPTNDRMLELLAADPAAEIVGPFTPRDPGTKEIETRNMVQVPAAFLPIIWDKRNSPRQLWTDLAGTIIAEGQAASCVHLLNWLKHALMLQKDPNDANAVVPPVNSMGRTSRIFPPLDEDERLQAHRWNILCTDLPALDSSRLLDSPQQMIQLVGALRGDRALERATDEARRIANKEPKPPSETKFKYVVEAWMRFAGVSDEEDLPAIYKDIANTDKAGHLGILRAHLKQHTTQASAATNLSPVPSKELLDVIKNAAFGAELHEYNDLTVGLQPFSAGLFAGDKLSKTVLARAEGYELMLQGQVNPTLSEQTTFSTKEVQLPRDIFGTEMMLSTYSVVLDVLQGPNARLAAAYRAFVQMQWRTIASTLHIECMYNDRLLMQVVPGLLRWLQVNILSHIGNLLRGVPTAPLPDFDGLSNLILLRQWHLLPPLPDNYRLDVQSKAKNREMTVRVPLQSPPSPHSRRPQKRLLRQAKACESIQA